MIKILITLIFGFVLMTFAQEGASPVADGKSTNSAEITDKANPDCASDHDCSKTAGIGKKPQDQEGKLTDNATKGCTNCKQPTKGRITSKTGAKTLKDENYSNEGKSVPTKKVK